MAVTQSVESIVMSKVEKMKELKTATALITNKDELKSPLLAAASEIDNMSRGIFTMRQYLDSLKQQNDDCRKYMVFLYSLEDVYEYAEKNIPPDLISALTNRENIMEIEKFQNGNCTMSSKKFNQINGDVVDPTEYTPKFTNSRKTLFLDSEDNYYSIEPLDNTEFAKIPKYMIGRHTLATLNDFITSINNVMKSKYSLLALGKNGARKRGELDLYLKLKKEEIDVCPKNEKKYFFNAEDYQRETKYKLDKTKLNLLTVLRHCKKIQELRTGKNVRYEVIATSR